MHQILKEDYSYLINKLISTFWQDLFLKNEMVIKNQFKFHSYVMARIGKSVETESKLLVARGLYHWGDEG